MILQPSSYCKTYVLLIFTTPGDKSKPLNLPTKQTAQIKYAESILLRYKADGFIHVVLPQWHEWHFWTTPDIFYAAKPQREGFLWRVSVRQSDHILNITKLTFVGRSLVISS